MKIGKVMKIGCLGILIFCVIAVVFITQSIKSGNEYVKAVRNLPEVEGVLYTDDAIIAPLSGESVAAVLLKSTGYYKGTDAKANSSGPLKTDNYFFVAKNLEIEIDGHKYLLNGNIQEALVLNGTVTDKRSENRLIDSRYVGLDQILNSNLESYGFVTADGAIQIDDHYGSRSLEELIFKSGDTIRLKAEVTDDECVVLTWMDAK